MFKVTKDTIGKHTAEIPAALVQKIANRTKDIYKMSNK